VDVGVDVDMGFGLGLVYLDIHLVYNLTYLGIHSIRSFVPALLFFRLDRKYFFKIFFSFTNFKTFIEG
jgi:hypothetical protein